MRDRFGKRCVAAVVASSLSVPVLASETLTYSYDALGRLISSVASAGPSTGADVVIQYDPAGNRTSYQVTGSPNINPADVMVVVPMNGFLIIPAN